MENKTLRVMTFNEWMETYHGKISQEKRARNIGQYKAAYAKAMSKDRERAEKNGYIVVETTQEVGQL